MLSVSYLLLRQEKNVQIKNQEKFWTAYEYSAATYKTDCDVL
jgi:hypothetical protein